MANLTGIPVLDVAIGLSFVFLLLSLVASTGQEIVANLFALRARTLERGLRNMLADDAEAPAGSAAADARPAGPGRDLVFRLYTHPLIRSLYRESWFPLGRKTLTAKESHAQRAVEPTLAAVSKVRLPSYIAPRSFALALLDTVAPDVLATDPTTGKPRPDHDVLRQTRGAIEGLGIPSGVKHRLLTLLDDARGDIDAFRLNVEAWFDDTMARVSGWYKRRTQLIIFVLAGLVTLALNANAITMGERLWRDPVLRATLVEKAAAANGTTHGKTARERLNNAVDDVEAVAKAGVPIGWAQGKGSGLDPRHVDLRDWGWARALGGWLLTVLAVSLGAPFWFDTLSRLARLRGTGKPETPLPASGRGQPGERIVTDAPPVNVAVQPVPTIAGAVTRPVPARSDTNAPGGASRSLVARIRDGLARALRGSGA